ncbi:glycosyltransferase [Streptomyces capillispiralis]|uniref:Glycosyltransferase involved in cell wall biosynthesis n=1 Tax=Streptomyces capillispiralis TaxID=68182 RepID=A0A561TK39_9ACTN|nr:glycosyltransferase [Streptomyces capillispiralis]TWF87404.1 glycosyltransferase involved in cell wall biosynthesis [Streptomyces capillispiralis]GHH92672.1 glycosyl transferase family 1 [Streptomyces capillispiralis]
MPTDLSSRGRRPRVLHLTQPVDGGVARVVTDLVGAQLADGLDVTAACPDSALTSQLRSLGAQVRHWRATRSPGAALAREVRQLARLIDEVRPDLVHAHSAKAGLAGRLAVRGRIPTVFQPHAWSFEAVGGGTAALALRWERWAARWAARVVCVSEAERATGAHAGITGRWTVIPNGIDPERFRPAPADAVRAALAPLAGLRAQAPLAVCVGRLCRQKGQDVLLRAWDTVVRRVPDARLVLVGDGPERDRLRAAAPASVLFAGAVSDASHWYQAADLVVLPSRWEGMALAPLEAMACGRPVVVTDVDGARESLPPAFTDRCLVPPEDPGALAAAVGALLLDPTLRASLGDRGRRHVLSLHDVRHTARAVTDVYRDLLGTWPDTTEARPHRTVGGAGADRATQRAEPSEHRESIHS